MAKVEQQNGMAVAAMLPNPAHTYDTGFRKIIITLTVIVSAMLELIDTTIVNVALTQISGNLGASIDDAAWVITSYAIANVIVIPLSGFLGNLLGRRNYYIGSGVIACHKNSTPAQADMDAESRQKAVDVRAAADKETAAHNEASVLQQTEDREASTPAPASTPPK